MEIATEERAGVETVYVVLQLNWEYNDNWHEIENDTPLRAFADAADAEVYRRRLEVEKRAEIAGTGSCATDLERYFGGFVNMSTLSPEAFRRRLAELWIPAPEEVRSIDPIYGALHQKWWETVWTVLPPDHVDAFWALFDLLRFYEVVPVEVEA